MTRFEEAATAIADELKLPRNYTIGVLRSLALANKIAKAQVDLTGCVSVQFNHSHPGRTVLTDKPPQGLTIYPVSERALSRER